MFITDLTAEKKKKKNLISFFIQLMSIWDEKPHDVLNHCCVTCKALFISFTSICEHQYITQLQLHSALTCVCVCVCACVCKRDT